SGLQRRYLTQSGHNELTGSVELSANRGLSVSANKLHPVEATAAEPSGHRTLSMPSRDPVPRRPLRHKKVGGEISQLLVRSLRAPLLATGRTSQHGVGGWGSRATSAYRPPLGVRPGR